MVVLLLTLYLLLRFSWHALPCYLHEIPFLLVQDLPIIQVPAGIYSSHPSQLTLEPILSSTLENILMHLFSSFDTHLFPPSILFACVETVSGRRGAGGSLSRKPRVARNMLLELNMANTRGRWELRGKKVMHTGDYVSHDLGAHSLPRVVGAESWEHIGDSLYEPPFRTVWLWKGNRRKDRNLTKLVRTWGLLK